MKDTIIPPRLRWACRRGMLELDVMLGAFLEEAYLQVSEETQKQFVDLLSENDQNLFVWLTGKEVPENSVTSSIIQKIRHHAKHRHQS